jgi:hypothetical protein
MLKHILKNRVSWNMVARQRSVAKSEPAVQNKQERDVVQFDKLTL